MIGPLVLLIGGCAVIAAVLASYAYHLGYEAGHERGREYERVRIQKALDGAEGRVAEVRKALAEIGTKLGWPA